MCTWWSSYHVMVLESLGVPVGVLATETYQTNHFLSSQSIGNTRQRRIVVCDLRRPIYMNATPTVGAAGQVPTPPGTQDAGQFFRRDAIDANRAAGGRIAAMIHHFGQQPLSPVLLQRTDPDRVAARKFATPQMMAIRDDHWAMSGRSVIEQAVWAALGPLTEDDINPYPILPTELGCLNDGVIGPANEITFEAPTRELAVRKFMDFARDNDFGDGFALIPPEPHLVDEMLAATTRDRNDVVGRMFLRGGAITIENLAINAVMTGIKPEAFPVVVAMGEALGHGWEDNHAWWHIMTGNTHELAMIVSGPVVDEIGMATGVGQAGAGNAVNNALGRTLRMMWRNIAHHIQPDLDISIRNWRRLDPVLIVVGENVAVTRELGWPTHSETLGFGDGSSSVSIVGASTGGAGLLSSASNGWQANWTASALTNMLLQGPANLGSPGAAWSGLTDANSSIITYSPAQARLLAGTHDSKQALIDARAHPQEIIQRNPAHPDFNPSDPFGLIGNTITLRYPIIIGADPGGAHAMNGGFHGSTAFVNQKVTGGAGVAPAATRGATAPSAPQNLVVEPLVLDAKTDTYSARLTWDAPKSDGGRPVTRYQLYYLSGQDDLAFRWLDIPGGADAREVTVTNLLPGIQYEFVVRARNDVNNATLFFNIGGDGALGPNRFNSRYPLLSEADRVERIGGRGGWAVAPPVTPPGRLTVMNSNRYPQLVGQDGPGIKLYYGNPHLGAAGERFFGPQGQIWNHLNQRIDRQYTPLRIWFDGAPAHAAIPVTRNGQFKFTAVDTIDGASTSDVVWTVSNPLFASVDADGNVKVNNIVGMITLSARDPITNNAHSIVLRIS